MFNFPDATHDLGRLRIASRDWRKNRLKRLRGWFLELRPILIATFVSGFVALALEVLWTRMVVMKRQR